MLTKTGKKTKKTSGQAVPVEHAQWLSKIVHATRGQITRRAEEKKCCSDTRIGIKHGAAAL